MIMLSEPTNAEEVDCPYISGEKFTQRYTFLKDLDQKDFDFMLLNGWRHFGYFFFTPNCNSCRLCTPIRTLIDDFKYSKSQRRNFRKNSSLLTVEFRSLEYREEYFEVYKKHSKVKFDQNSIKSEFKESFFQDSLSGNSRLSVFILEDKVIGVGFLDISETGISSVYFCYDTDYSHLGLGVFSVLKEIEYGKHLGKEYYYLGYYVEGNPSMEYKAKYTPSEILSWKECKWIKFRE